MKSRSSLTYACHFAVWFCLILSPVFSEAQIFTESAHQKGLFATYGDASNFGGGMSAYDFSGDGYEDLTLASDSLHPIYFYQNTGGVFMPVTFPGIDDTLETKQVIWVDYDNDGDADLFASANKGPNLIYVNDGTQNFSKMVLSKHDTIAESTITSYGATFSDLDLDGDLDLFMSHYSIFSVQLSSQLYINNGDGTFGDLTASSVFSGIQQPTFCVTAFDFDNDLDPDIYTAEDRKTGNRLFENLGAGVFADISAGSGADVLLNAMGIAVGDYDEDGDLDLYISNTPEGNALLRNNSDGTFTRVDSLAGVTYHKVGWGVNFLDFDNDIDLDLYVSGSSDIDRFQSQLYENIGGGLFDSVSVTQMAGDSTFSFSNVLGDFNGDGYIDLAVSNIGPDSLQLWENVGGLNGWLKVELEGTVSNRDGIGAWIEVYAGGRKQVRFTNCSIGFQGQNSQYELFGLGAELLVDSVVVRWPSGIVDRVNGVPGSTKLKVVEGDVGTGVVDGFGDGMGDGFGLLVWPNPFGERMWVQVIGGGSGNVGGSGRGNVGGSLNGSGSADDGWGLVDGLGRIVRSGGSDGLGGGAKVEIRVDGLAAGVYCLRVRVGDRVLLRRVVRR